MALPKGGVVVALDDRFHRYDISGMGFSQRMDLDHGAVAFHKHRIQVGHCFHGPVKGFCALIQPEVLGHAFALIHLEAVCNIDVFRKDRVGPGQDGAVGNRSSLVEEGSPGRRPDQYRALYVPIHQYRHIQFTPEREVLDEHQLVAENPLRGLLRDEFVAQHLLRNSKGFLRVGHEVDASLEPIVKDAGVRSPHQNLGF